MRTRGHSLLRSKTVWGALFTAGAWLLQQPTIGVAEVIQAAVPLLDVVMASGVVLTAAGVRDAIRKGPIE